MNTGDTFLIQTGLKSLGFDPGPVDGVDGPKTRAARAAWSASKATPPPDSIAALQLKRWTSAKIDPRRLPEVRKIVDRITAHKATYQEIQSHTGIPWVIIGALHNMEAGGSFRAHLHNGDPLTARTVQVPRGRPLTGSPPFTWQESAIDALRFDHLDKVDWSDIASSLYACERYNGTGYLKYHPSTPTPYLWAATTIETPGKYTSDGAWSPTARSAQIGVAAVMKAMA